MKLTGLSRAVRAHRGELIMFTVGALLFAAGFVTVLVRSGRIPPAGSGADVPEVGAPAPSVTVGPDEELRGDELAAYVRSRREHLDALAARSPRRESLGIASFTTYLAPAEAEEVLSGRRLTTLAVQVRLPLQGFEPVQLELTGSIASEVERYAQQAVAQLRVELRELEKIIPTVTDDSFRRVYEEDAELHRRGIALLSSDEPPIVIAVIVKGSAANLRSLGEQDRVSLVDIADEPDAGLRTHSFVAVRFDR